MDTITPEPAYPSLLTTASSYLPLLTRTGLVSPRYAHTPFLQLILLFAVGIQISTVPNPDSFDDFHTSNGSDQLAVPYFEGQGTQGCIPVSVGALNLPGIGDGSNVTLQIVQDGSDGSLYQVRQIFRFVISLPWLIILPYRLVHGLDPFLDLPNFIQCPMRQHHHNSQLDEQWWSYPHLYRSERRGSFGFGAGVGPVMPFCSRILLLHPLLGNFF